jgi:hypothetical protein
LNIALELNLAFVLGAEAIKLSGGRDICPKCLDGNLLSPDKTI